jgi:hypothetical protein
MSNEDNLRKNNLDSNWPIATHRGILKIGEIEIDCYVLQNGERILSGRALTKALGLSGRGSGMNRFLESKSLTSFFGDSLRNAINDPIQFLSVKNSKLNSFGYKAIFLPEICNAILDANDAKPLPPQQKKLAFQAKILSRAFSTVGIIALVDEATGYQEIRDRLALQEILEKYISLELRKWVKTFPDDFYKELFRLRGWNYTTATTKRSGFVGKLTDDLIYRRLAPGVRDELRRLTPKNNKGKLKDKLHQRLDENFGITSLENHFISVITLMKASSSWIQFDRMINRVLPRFGDTIPLPYDMPDE